MWPAATPTIWGMDGAICALRRCTECLSHFKTFAPQGDEWEEKWGEHYAAGGEANKYADKWGKDGPNVWHERWGEDYDGRGGCTKYTDKVGKNRQPIPLSP